MINTADLKQTLVARACSYELAHEICEEIERLRNELARATDRDYWIDAELNIRKGVSQWVASVEKYDPLALRELLTGKREKKDESRCVQ